ncbi:MAG TPA: hypothetical protein VET48_09655 [Steroidobacteraceae bacterium]|nr:hypothetical protein [Steroidobacteraceae bacterium]
MQFHRHIVTFAALALLGVQANSFAGGATTPTLFYLNIRGSEVVRVNADGTNRQVIVSQKSFGPDGIVVDLAAGHIYWTNMGKASVDDGTVMRANLDGSEVTTIVPTAGTFTPKQLKLDAEHGKLYWSDREGMRIMRANLDGSKIETLVVTGSGDADRKDASHWCVGIALDVAHGKIYWTQKGSDNAHKGTIKRASVEIPAGEDAAHRSDIEVLFANLPEPIDMDLDLSKQMMYWTDRGDNTISRAPMYPNSLKPVDPAQRKDREILVRDLHEAIGITLDLKHNKMYYTALGGEVGVAALNGKGARTLLDKQGALTGIAFVELRR